MTSLNHLHIALPTYVTLQCNDHSLWQIAGAVLLVVLSYLVPLLVGLGVTTQTADWTLGYFAAVGEHVSYPL